MRKKKPRELTPELLAEIQAESFQSAQKSKRKRHWFFRVFKSLLVVSVGLYSLVLISDVVTETKVKAETWSQAKIEEGKDFLVAKLKLVRHTTTIVPVQDIPLPKLVDAYSGKYGLEPVIAWAIIDKESSMRHDRIRFEQSWKDEYGKDYPRQRWMNDIEYDLIFSSFGLMQISYVIWKDTCGINSFTELLQPEKNLDCGLKIMAQCLDDASYMKSKKERLRYCFKRYNGSGPKAEQYADSVMSRLYDYSFDENKLSITRDVPGKEISVSEPTKVEAKVETTLTNAPEIQYVTYEGEDGKLTTTHVDKFQGKSKKRKS